VNSDELPGGKYGSVVGVWDYGDIFRIRKSREIVEQLKLHQVLHEGPIT
jgi:hypothetical protein